MPEQWPGPVKRTTTAALKVTKCVGHHEIPQKLSPEAIQRGDWWCEQCKDPEGYTDKMRQAQADALKRLQEAYPVQEAEQLSISDLLMPNKGGFQGKGAPLRAPFP